jgi:hypothetical protein
VAAVGGQPLEEVPVRAAEVGLDRENVQLVFYYAPILSVLKNPFALLAIRQDPVDRYLPKAGPPAS